jgi:dGTPase
VDLLEAKYAEFPGLNLMFETREGILKHCSKANARELGDVGERFLRREHPGLEAQIADISDAIAYNNHDVDDGIRAGLLTTEQLCEQELFATAFDQVRARYPDLEDRRLVYETIRRMIGKVVTDLIETTRANIEAAAPGSIDDVRRAGRVLVTFSSAINEQHVSLKRFLYQHLYSHEKKLDMTDRAQRIVRELFELYTGDTSTLPDEFKELADAGDKAGRARVVADYIAGMTDRYAIAEHERLL